MNLNARDILVVHIGFLFLIISLLTSEGGGQTYLFEKCLVLGDFFLRQNTSILNNLLNNIEKKLFIF